MLKKDIVNGKTKYCLTDIAKSFIRSVSFILLTGIMVVLMTFSSIAQSNAGLVVNFSRSSEEISAAKARTAEVVDIVMTAEDFLKDGERAADYENIREYIDELRKNGINNDINKSLNTSDEVIDESEDVDMDENGVDIEEEAELSNEDNMTVADEERETPDKDDWRLILVNKQNLVPEGYNAELANINGSLKADERIIDDIYKMLDAANEAGVNLMICSAYRSYERQTELFNNKINKLMHKGMSYMEAYKVGSMSVTVPGTSEHQLGLALDILTGSYTSMDDGFGDTNAGKWLAENAPKYGFILRYPKGKEEITGIIYEPWHFRYVGTDYSMEITELGVCLEEYLNGEY